MPILNNHIPLALYIHIPWCVQKCPYCDFNSHQLRSNMPEDLYVAALLDELDWQLEKTGNRSLTSIFIGGGTPSLFSARAIGSILEGVNQRIDFAPNIEITMEANPGTVDNSRFADFYATGVNRLSLGIQSLDNEKLKILGRIHGRDTALRAVEIARTAGFDNVNLDMMFGLPNQTVEEALSDIKTALACAPTHFSWYQLTIEPNTIFYRKPPTLPADDHIWDMQLAGQALLREQGYAQYEVSAYAQPGKQCGHNRNYWEFGDYLGIGAGAHSKLTGNTIERFAQVKQPRNYLDQQKRRSKTWQAVAEKELPFEFMLNALRLTDGIATELFEARTGLLPDVIADALQNATLKGLLEINGDKWTPTTHGQRYLNDLMGLFL